MEIVKAELVDADSIYRRIGKIGEDIVQLSRDYAEALTVNRALRDELAGRGVPKELLRRMERLGRGSITPALVFASSPVAEKLMGLPVSEQEDVLQNGVAVLNVDGLDHRMIPYAELSSEQVKQVFGDGALRSLCQQRTWLENKREEERMREPISQVEVLYQIRGKRVVFTRPCEMTAKQLAMILAEIQQ